MTVKLRVRRLTPGDTPRGRMPKLRRQHITRRGQHPSARAFTDHRHLTPQMLKRTRDRPTMRKLDTHALLLRAKRPHRRNRLRRRERQVDPARPPAVGARLANELAADRMAALHQRDELLRAHRLARLQPQPFARLIKDVPYAMSLRWLTRRRQVVIPARRRHRPRLQIRGVPRRLARTDTRSRHHRHEILPR
jgi:hypothetical protein